MDEMTKGVHGKQQIFKDEQRWYKNSENSMKNQISGMSQYIIIVLLISLNFLHTIFARTTKSCS
jgi:hypothetical protein